MTNNTNSDKRAFPVAAGSAIRLRDKTGFGLAQCNKALEKCNNDEVLAEAWLRYDGCAINVRPRPGETRQTAYDRWVMDRAKGPRRSSWPVMLARAERKILKAETHLRERARHWDARGYSAIARELFKSADEIHDIIHPTPNAEVSGRGANKEEI